MRDKDLYAQLLGLRTPWGVDDVQIDRGDQKVTVTVSASSGAEWTCPRCGKVCPRYDRRKRKWRHLDTMQYTTILEAEVPRIECAEHGVVTVDVPWAEAGSGFSALFEALVIDWLQEASVQAVSEQLGLSWNAVDRIQQRAVARGLARRPAQPARQLGVDETSFQKRHEYVTVLSDVDRGCVLAVSDDRKQTSLESCLTGLSSEQRASVEAVSMDMWRPYINAVQAQLPDAEIAFDRFHVVQAFNKAIDDVRRAERRALKSTGSDPLKGTRYDWLKRQEGRRSARFLDLCNSALKTARAWAIKETANQLWNYRRYAWAAKAWKKLLGWMSRSRLTPMVKLARTLRRHLEGILTAVIRKISNGPAEAINSGIQKVKRRAHGFRNRERFRTAILFHLGGLDLYPDHAKLAG
jgi:transposase